MNIFDFIRRIEALEAERDALLVEIKPLRELRKLQSLSPFRIEFHVCQMMRVDMGHKHYQAFFECIADNSDEAVAAWVK